GTTVVTWNFDDGNGNSSMQTQNVVIDDVTDPVAPTLADITGECSATVPVPTTTDNCAGTVTGSTSDPLTYTTQGTFTVTWNFDDGNGNDIDVVQTVIVDDVTAPIVSCPENITVSNDAGQCGAIVTFNATATDNCGGTPTITYSQNPGTFFPVGITTVNVTADDGNGNMANCSFTVTVEDNESPNAVCQNVTVTLDSSGNATITPLDIGSGSTDNCGIASISLDKTMFDCSDVGANTVTLTVTDVNGNSSTCSATVTVEDNVAPTAICQDLTVQLDASGAATITAAQIDNGSSDNCGIASISLDETMFDCADVGANTVTLTVTDVNGNSSTCSATVTVEDNVAPTAVCQDLTVQLDASGAATITAAQIDNGSSDNCGIASISLDETMFDCSDVGANTVTLTVTDVNGNSSTCSATVTVEDNVAPTAVCQDLTVQLDASGAATITAAQIDNGSSDNCGIASISLDETMFDCADVGANTVTLTVTDASGNSSMCTTTVTVEDNTNPTAVCQDITVSLDGTGSAIITANDVDGGSSDACGIATLEIDVNSFTCADLGSNDVVLTVTDNSGNTSTCTASVTVEDNEAPVLTCVADPTVTINQSNNTYLVSGTEFDPSVADNCFAFLFVSHNAGDFVSQPSGTSNTSLAGWEFPIGTTTVTFSVVDAGDNEDMCTVTITVLPTQIAGNVLLNGACLPLDMTVSVYQTGSQTSTGVLVATFSGVQLDANGDFSFDATGVVPGNYDLYFKPENYLTKLSDNQTVSTSATGVALTNMVPGDIDNSEDNQIDGDDVSPILTAYNTEDGVDAGYNADADLNCDGFVDALDLSLIIFFFLTEGDAPMN
ncbi:MAG: HYR domain-containing protein, partial [Flavobacteriales bacterium]|nr:HYR domain-containing protein [Flavobacteriales bacterium]